MQKPDHSGHRSRMREKYKSSGLDIFAPHEVLELMLFYAIPYRNTNDIAKNLIDRFGSLSNVLDAPVDSLIEAGLTENQAIYLKLFSDVTRAYYRDKFSPDTGPLDFERLPEYIAGRFIGINGAEHVLLLLADAKGKEVFCSFISEGDFASANFSMRSIVRLAINYGAYTAFIAHNHPSGVALPSREDLRATLRLREALSLVGVRLLDHFIIGDNECVSLAQSGFLNDDE